MKRSRFPCIERSPDSREKCANDPFKKKRKKKYGKKSAHPGNRTLVSTVGGYYDTTTPDALHVSIFSLLFIVKIIVGITPQKGSSNRFQNPISAKGFIHLMLNGHQQVDKNSSAYTVMQI